MNRFSKLNKGAKKAFASFMAVALVSTTTSVATFIVEADDPYEDMFITDFDTLPESVAYQSLEVGASESDIIFPSSLNVTFMSYKKKDAASDASSSASSGASEASTSSSEASSASSEASSAAADATSASDYSNSASTASQEADANEDASTSGSGSESMVEDEHSSSNTGNHTDADVTTPAADTVVEEQNATDLETPAPATEDGDGNAEPQEEGGLDGAWNSLKTATKLARVYAAEDIEELSEGTRITLYDTTWILDESRSSHNQFLAYSENAGDHYTYVPDMSGFDLSENITLPSIRVTIYAEEEEQEILYPFDATATVDGIVITVTAPEGVFPEGAYMEAYAVGGRSEIESIEGQISDRIEEGKEIEDLITIDITIYDSDGNEIEPDTSYGDVSVSFSQLSMASQVSEEEDSELKVFHFNEESGNVDEVGAQVEGDTASFTIGSFSKYTIIKVVSSSGLITSIPVSAYSGTYDGVAHDLVTIGDFDSSVVSITTIAVTGAATTTTTYPTIPTGINAGTYTVTVTYTANSTSGSVEVEATITPKTLTSSMISLSPSDATSSQHFAYDNGNAVTPTVTVTDEIDGSTYVLTQGTDYDTPVYSNNTDIASSSDTNAPTVSVTGQGNYTGTAEVTFSIGAEVDTPTVTLYDGTYDGAAHNVVTATPTYNTTQVQSILYKVDNGTESTTIPTITDAGVYEVTITFKGKTGYCDYVYTDYANISARNISECTVSLRATSTSETDTDEFAYTGSAVEPYVLIKYGSTAFTYMTDYSCTYTNNTAIADKTASTPPTVTVTGTGNLAGTATIKFSIVASADDVKVLYNGSSTKKDWYNSDVVVTVPGYKMCTTKDGTYADKYTITGEGTAIGATLYLKNNSTGVIVSPPVAATANIDRTAPKGTVYVSDYSSSDINTSKDVAFTTRDRHTIRISSEDALSGVVTVEYYISSKLLSDISDIESTAKGKWISYNDNARPKISDNAASFVCARITDAAGNIKYITTKGIIHDTEGPTVKSVAIVADGNTAHIKVVAEDKLSGVSKYYLLQYAQANAPSSMPDADTVKGGYESESGEFTISADSSTNYVYYAVAMDKVGNLGKVYKKEKNGSGAKTSTSAKNSSSKSSLAATPNGIAGGPGSSTSSSGNKSSGNGSKSSTGSSSTGSGSSSSSGRLDLSQIEIKRDPYIYDATGNVHIGEELTSSWTAITSEVNTASEGSFISVDMRGTSTVPTEFISTLQSKNVDVQLKMGDDYRWTINGESIKTIPDNDIDLRVTRGSRNIPSSLINQIADSYPHYDFNVVHNGEFGFTARLTMNVDSVNAGYYGYLYYYDVDKGELQLIDSSLVDEDGDVSYELSHASDYTIIIKPNLYAAGTSDIGDSGTIENYTNAHIIRTTGYISSSGKLAGIRNWLIIIAIISLIFGAVILIVPQMQQEDFKLNDVIVGKFKEIKKLNFNKNINDPWE
jgi:hypothetical protein